MLRETYTIGRIVQNNLFAKIGNVELHNKQIILKDFPEKLNAMYYWSKTEDGFCFHDKDYIKMAKFEPIENPYTEIWTARNGLDLFYLYKNKNVKAKFKLLVSSHINYLDKTGIKDDLEGLGFTDDEIVYVVSGNSNEEVEGNHLNATTNHWEYSALLRASRLTPEEAPEYWFLLHDTAIPGFNFKEKLNKYDFTVPFDLVSLNDKGIFNMGFYKHDFLIRIQDFLFQYKDMTKQDGIKMEINCELRRKAKIASCTSEDGLILTGRRMAVWGKLIRAEKYSIDMDISKYYFDTTKDHPHVP